MVGVLAEQGIKELAQLEVLVVVVQAATRRAEVFTQTMGKAPPTRVIGVAAGQEPQTRMAVVEVVALEQSELETLERVQPLGVLEFHLQ
jgi:hypothetical protein